MCLIIHKEPNFELPYEKFKAAITNNPDGYGLTYPEDGRLNVLRTPETPDPDKLYRMVNEELKELDVMLHLRYNTAGETNLRNAHPFSILEKNADGMDLRMAHNGTLYPYKNKAGQGESDTRAFVRLFVRPLFKRMAKGMSAEDLMTDPFIAELLEDKLTTASVLTFMDNEGNVLKCNAEGNGGKQDDGWYYSNTYSFDEEHRLPYYQKKANKWNGGQYSSGKPWKNTTHTQTRHGTNGGSSNVLQISQGAKSTIVKKFTTKYDLEIEDLANLNDDVIEQAVQHEQEDAVLLIKELSYLLYTDTKKINNLTAQLEIVKKKLGEYTIKQKEETK